MVLYMIRTYTGIVYDKDMYLFWVTDYGAPGVPPPPLEIDKIKLNVQL